MSNQIASRLYRRAYMLGADKTVTPLFETKSLSPASIGTTCRPRQ